MDKYAIYEAWAPTASVWSPWVKPAPFAHLPRPPRVAVSDFHAAELWVPPVPPPQFDLGWLPTTGERCAIVVDLPGTAAIYFGLHVAGLGWQPVSLINACPPPDASPQWPGFGFIATVDVTALLDVITAAAPELAACPPPPDAPPVFILDANRQARGKTIGNAIFDNRSVVFASDFPSARTLAAHGITRVLVVRDAAVPAGRDLAHALAPWQKADVVMNLVGVDGSPLADALPRTGWLAEMWFRFTIWSTLRRNPLGGYGGFVPESSGG